MDNKKMWAIRDTRGLTSLEKVFLFTVESRGQMTCTATTAALDMGMSKASYYRTRDALIASGCLTQRQSAWVVTDPSEWKVSHTETPESHTETHVSHTETKPSHTETHKKNKEEQEEEMKEEQVTPAPSGPVVTEVSHPCLREEESSLVYLKGTTYFLNSLGVETLESLEHEPDPLTINGVTYSNHSEAKKARMQLAAKSIEEAW